MEIELKNWSYKGRGSIPPCAKIVKRYFDKHKKSYVVVYRVPYTDIIELGTAKRKIVMPCGATIIATSRTYFNAPNSRLSVSEKCIKCPKVNPQTIEVMPVHQKNDWTALQKQLKEEETEKIRKQINELKYKRFLAELDGNWDQARKIELQIKRLEEVNRR